MKKLESKTVAILSYIDPASAIILSSIVFMTLPETHEIIGVVLIMSGAIWSEMEIKTQKNSAE
jgi:drug/metabolite transporter (DMT)-like permease